MDRLNDLVSLLASLNTDEIENVRQHVLFSVHLHKTEKQTEYLLGLAIQQDINQLSEIQKKLGAPKFSSLIQNLYGRVLEVLSLDINLQRAIYSHVSQSKLFIRKQILQAQILGSKGQISQVVPLLKKIITRASGLELYDEQLICLYELLNLYSARGQIQNLNETISKIKHYEQIRHWQKEGYILYNRIMLLMRLNPEDKSTIEECETALPKLKSYYDISNTYMTGWFYYRLLTEYQQKKEKYAEGYVACQQMLRLQQESMLLHNKTLLSITYKLMARFCLGVFRFDEALLYINESSKLENASSLNIETIRITEFHIHFIKNDIPQARAIILKLIKKNTELSSAIYSYFMACCLLLENKSPSHLFEHLSKTKEIEKDKEGWNIYVRLLQIMHLCEGKKWDVAQAHIENLRKHLERTRKSGTIQPRFSAIFKALRELTNCGFDFGKALKKQPDLFALLSSETDEDHRWRMLTPELIRFDAWFEAKARHLHYTEVFAERVKVRQAQNGYLTD